MRNKSFTLIELLVAIALIGILSGFVFVQLSGAINTARDGEKKANLASINKALLIYKTTTGAYPIETSSCTIGGTCTTLNSALSGTLPSMPSGQTYTYQSNSDGSDYTASIVLSNSYSYTYAPSAGYTTNTPTVGVCGSSNGANLSSAPTTNLCSPDQSVTVSGSGPWTWSCPGTYGGSSTSCSTGGVPAAGVCGSKNGKYASSTPTGTEACSIGTVSNMTGSYSWTCAGTYGAASSGTCATVAAAYSVQSFTSSTTWTVPAGVTSVDYLVVGGGGGGAGSHSGGVSGGGGGGGGVLSGTLSVSGSVTVTVGAGGAYGPPSTSGSNGGNSVFGSVTSYGGGGGGASISAGNSGGSGGGGGSTYMAGGSGTSGQGYGGGTGYNDIYGGAGGGAGAAATNASSSGGGTAGSGKSSSITGSTLVYGGGGGGGSNTGTRVSGGSGGGGAGGDRNTSQSPVNGTDGLGGGGGGGTWGVNGYYGANGGSGIVIIKYINNN